MSTLRLLGVGWYFQFKMILRSPFDGIGNVLYPLFFATTALFVFRAGQSPRTLIYASLGAAVMGMWSSVSTSAGSAMQRERWWGTLELLVAAPRHFSLVCFRRDASDEENEELVARLNRSGELFLSHTRLDGRYVLRLAIGNERTTEEDVRRAWEALRQA